MLPHGRHNPQHCSKNKKFWEELIAYVPVGTAQTARKTEKLGRVGTARCIATVDRRIGVRFPALPNVVQTGSRAALSHVERAGMVPSR
jgi:hypothetical protein